MFSFPWCSEADEADAVGNGASDQFCWWSNMIWGICGFSEMNILAFEGVSSCHSKSAASLWHACILRSGRTACVYLSFLLHVLHPLCHYVNHRTSRGWAFSHIWQGGARLCEGVCLCSLYNCKALPSFPSRSRSALLVSTSFRMESFFQLV